MIYTIFSFFQDTYSQSGFFRKCFSHPTRPPVHPPVRPSACHGSQVIKLVRVPVCPGSLAIKMVRVPVFPGSEAIKMVRFPIFPGPQASNPTKNRIKNNTRCLNRKYHNKTYVTRIPFPAYFLI